MTDVAKLKAQIKEDIRSCLISTNRGLKLRELSRDFRNLLGENIPFKTCGYSSLEQFIKDMPDVVRITYHNGEMILSGIPTKEIEHLDKLIKAQKTKSPKSVVFNSLQYNNSPQTTYSRQRVQIVPQNTCVKIKKLLEAHSKTGLPLTSFQMTYSQFHGTELNMKQMGFTTLENCLESITDVVLDRSTQDVRVKLKQTGQSIYFQQSQTVDEEHFENEEPQLHKNVRSNIQKVLKNSPNGIWIYDFEEEYKKICSSELIVNELGYNDITEFVDVFPSLFACKQTANSYGKETISLFDPEDFIKHEASVKEITPNINDATLANLINIIDVYPEGIDEQQLQAAYMMNFKENIPWTTSGCKSYRDFLILLHKLGNLDISSNDTGLTKLTSKSATISKQRSGLAEVPRSSRSQPTGNPLPYCDISGHHDSNSKAPHQIPPDVVLPGVEYIYEWFSESHDLTKFFKAFISQVNTPSNIWIQLIGEHYCLALDSLMSLMNKYYYGLNGSKYVMPSTYILKSMICAAVYPEDYRWHRGIITGIPSEDTIQVLFVDYGTEAIVKCNNICFLKQDFLYLPAQGIKARLAGIKPVEYEWSPEAQKILLTYCTVPLYVKVLNVNYKGRVSVALCYVDDDEELHLNDFLVLKGLALRSQDDDDDDQYGNKHLTYASPEMANLTVTVENNSADNSLYSSVEESPKPANKRSVFATSPKQILELNDSHSLKQYGDVNPSVEENLSQHLSDQSAVEENQTPYFTDGSMTLEFSSDAMSKNSSPEIYQSEDGDDERLAYNTVEEIAQTRFCQKVDYNDEYKAHLINYEGKLHLTSGELSSYIYGVNIIDKILRIKQVSLKSTVVQKMECPNLFKELEKYNVPGFSPIDKPKNELFLYSLQSCLKILSLSNHNSVTLRKGIEESMKSFDPNDSYWTEVDEEEIKAVFTSEIPAMKSKVLALTQKKKTILNEMLIADDDVETTKTLYNRLSVVLQEISLLKRTILETKEKGLEEVVPKNTNTLYSSPPEQQNVSAVPLNNSNMNCQQYFPGKYINTNNQFTAQQPFQPPVNNLYFGVPPMSHLMNSACGSAPANYSKPMITPYQQLQQYPPPGFYHMNQAYFQRNNRN